MAGPSSYTMVSHKRCYVNTIRTTICNIDYSISIISISVLFIVLLILVNKRLLSHNLM